MGVFENLPYTNFHELNLNWLVQKMKELLGKVESMDVDVATANAAAEAAEAAAARAETMGVDIAPVNIKSSITANTDKITQFVGTAFQSGYVVDINFAIIGTGAINHNDVLLYNLPEPKQGNPNFIGVNDDTGAAFYVDIVKDSQTNEYNLVMGTIEMSSGQADGFVHITYLAKSLYEEV